ncbi:MAG TPA: type VI secretion system baseplate subunit TssG [Syntrophorhabdaceae bacterium]|nr:type VI secretion system baseplate subunit TssG [Syntrophorhabdaceae bacterium]
MPGIIEDLFSNGSSFSFVQAMRLLSHHIHAEGDKGEEIMRRRIKVRPDLSLTFPGNDIISIARKRGNPDIFSITATFLGLYGASSPLPTFYTEDLLEEASDDRSISRDFIDIINMPAYHLFYKCSLKYNLFFKITESTHEEAIDRLYCLLGFGSEKIKKCFDEPYRFLRYIGLATQMPRSAEGLRSLISDAIGEPSIGIEQCVPAMVAIPPDQRLLLGVSGHCLGENASIGFEVSDCTGRFRIHAGPISDERFHDLLPDGEAFGRIGKLVSFYLDLPLEWDIEIEVAPEEIRPACLGEETRSRLGWDMWLNADGQYHENRVRLGR